MTPFLQQRNPKKTFYYVDLIYLKGAEFLEGKSAGNKALLQIFSNSGEILVFFDDEQERKLWTSDLSKKDFFKLE